MRIFVNGTDKPRLAGRNLKKHQTFMRFAVDISKLSTCKRLKVGTIITDARMERVLGIGYNGNASGMQNTCDTKTPGHCGCIHSEINALIKCGSTDRKKLMFVTTRPCIMCAKSIINSGFSRVYYKREYRKDFAAVEEMFDSAMIGLIKLTNRKP